VLLYTTLTAILAGIYTASIGLFQRAFVALTGERSDAAIVLTTLVVASAFTPLRGRVQAILDRRLKETRDPTKELSAFCDQVQSVALVIDVDELASRLLEKTVDAAGAVGGAIYLGEPERLVHSTGVKIDDGQLRVRLQHGETVVGTLTLGPRRSGAAYAESDRRALERTGAIVAQAIVIVERAFPPSSSGADRSAEQALSLTRMSR
jgi:hypothetical protein